MMLRVTNDWDDVQAAHDREDVVVYFTADWCAPCRQLKPQYARASVIDADRNYFLVDIDKVQPYVLKDWNIQSVPQVILWEKDQLTDFTQTIVTSRKAQEIVDEVNELGN
jgi:thioredoxin 1